MHLLPIARALLLHCAIKSSLSESACIDAAYCYRQGRPQDFGWGVKAASGEENFEKFDYEMVQ